MFCVVITCSESLNVVNVLMERKRYIHWASYASYEWLWIPQFGQWKTN